MFRALLTEGCPATAQAALLLFFLGVFAYVTLRALLTPKAEMDRRAALPLAGEDGLLEKSTPPQTP